MTAAPYINSLLNHISKTLSARYAPSFFSVMISFSKRAFLKNHKVHKPVNH